MARSDQKEDAISRSPLQDIKAYRLRLRTFFGSSCAAALLGFLLHSIISRGGGNIPTQSLPQNILLLPPAILFILGTLLTLWIKPNKKVLEAIEYSVTGLAIASLTVGFLHPSLIPLLPFLFGVIVLWHSVVIPSRIAGQIVMAALALIVFFIGSLWLADQTMLERSGALMNSAQMLVLLAISVAVSYALRHTHTNLLETQNISNYRLLRELGAGGMGRVYAASHAFLCRPTAIKVMEPQPGGDLESAIARFEKEIRLSASLTHPNTITIFDYGRSDEDTFFYAMELLEGMDLQKLVERFGPMSAGRVVNVLEQICGALAEAHAKGIIHRDIKPSNIFLSRQGGLYDFVKVLDFGLAKELNENGKDDLTRSGELVGTPRYIAPESISAKDQIDGRTDIYLLGAVAFFMLTGRAPFEGDTGIEVIVEHLTQEPQRPSEVSELKIPKDLEAIVLKCLQKNPDERFQTVTELDEALRRVKIDEAWTQEKAKEWWTLHPPPEVQMDAPQKSPAELRSFVRRRA